MAWLLGFKCGSCTNWPPNALALCRAMLKLSTTKNRRSPCPGFKSGELKIRAYAGHNWENVGWRVQVRFTELGNKVRPKDHIDILRPLLPARYSPLQPNGHGLQSVYLTELPQPLAEVLMGLIGDEVAPITLAASHAQPVSADDLDAWEQKLKRGVVNDLSIPETDRLAIILAPKGQRLFRQRVSKIETKCRITGVENPAHLVGSYLKRLHQISRF